MVTKSFKVIKITSIDKNSNWFYGETKGSVDKFHFAIFKRYATPEETESALIKEAKSRGHKYDVYSWNHEQNTLYGHRGNDEGHDILFENGVWSGVS